MIDKLEINYLSISEYNRATSDRKIELAPEVPAVYFWVFDFRRVRRGMPRDLIDKILQKFSGGTGSEMRFEIGRYHEGTARMRRRVMNDDRRALVVEHLEQMDAVGELIADAATLLQRPYYCGETENFGRRIGEHVQGQSDFARAFDPRTLGIGLTDEERMHRLGMDDCAVLWIDLSSALQKLKLYDPEGATTSKGVAADGDANTDEGDYAQISAAEQVSTLESDGAMGFTKQAEPTPLKRTLRAIESLMIAAATPIYNKKM